MSKYRLRVILRVALIAISLIGAPILLYEIYKVGGEIIEHYQETAKITL